MTIRAAFLAFLAAILLMGCGDAARDSARLDTDAADAASTGPALWEIHGDAGLEGWLFGTIHALPRSTSWRTDRFDRAFDASDLLVLEISEYDEDSFDRDAILRRLAITRGLPLPSMRLDREHRTALRSAFAEAGIEEADFRNVESWAVALSLSSAVSRSDLDLGVDRVLFGEAKSRPDYRIVALEGAEAQLRIFDRLSQPAQRALLQGVAVEAAAQDDAMGRLDSWQTGDLDGLKAEITTGYMAEPSLLAALLDDRNRAWVPKIAALLAKNGKPFIAVGAGHMLGDAALQELLAKDGYRLKRIQ